MQPFYQITLKTCFTNMLSYENRQAKGRLAYVLLLLLSFFLWSPYVIGHTIILSSFGFFYLSSSSFLPRLISAVGDWMSTILPHMVWP